MAQQEPINFCHIVEPLCSALFIEKYRYYIAINTELSCNFCFCIASLHSLMTLILLMLSGSLNVRAN